MRLNVRICVGHIQKLAEKSEENSLKFNRHKESLMEKRQNPGKTKHRKYINNQHFIKIFGSFVD